MSWPTDVGLVKGICILKIKSCAMGGIEQGSPGVKLSSRLLSYTTIFVNIQ